MFFQIIEIGKPLEMSGKISWLMPEQMGPASDLYQNFAESLDKEQAETEAEQ